MCGSICVGGCFHYEKSEKPSKTLSHIHGKAPISKMKRTKKGLHRPLRLRLIHQFPKKLIGKKLLLSLLAVPRILFRSVFVNMQVCKHVTRYPPPKKKPEKATPPIPQPSYIHK